MTCDVSFYLYSVVEEVTGLKKLLISQFYWDAFASKTLIYLIGITSGLTIKNECAILLSDYACHYLLGNNMVVIIKLSVYSLSIVYNQNIIYTFFFRFFYNKLLFVC